MFKKIAEIKQKRMCSKEQHIWNGCKCSSCGKTRDEQHRWNGCVCVVCGQTRDKNHKWEGCKCVACGAIRNEEHKWSCCYCEICKETRRIEDGLKYYSEKPDCEECDSEAGDAEELLEYCNSLDDWKNEKEYNICPLTTIRCSSCKRIVISSNEIACAKNYKNKNNQKNT